MKKIIIAVTIILLLTGCSKNEEKQMKTYQEVNEQVATENLVFELNDEKTGYVCVGIDGPFVGELVIPSLYNGYPVVGVLGFNGYDGIRSVYIGENVTYIHAFRECHGLEYVEFGKKIEEISGFSECTSLTSVSFPDSMKSLHGFLKCEKLVEATFGNAVEEIGSTVFDDCPNLGRINYNGTIAEWCQITYENNSYYADPEDYFFPGDRDVYCKDGTVSGKDAALAFPPR